MSLLCLLLDVAKQLHEEEEPAKEFLIVNHRYFYDNSYSYGSIDRIGGVLSHLFRVFKNEVSEALGVDHEEIPQQQSETTNILRDLYATMFLVRNFNEQTNIQYIPSVEPTPKSDEPITPGNVDNHKSICEIIDCCIMFYTSCAVKYVVMIADLRDNISHLSNILRETKNCRDEVSKNLEEYKNSVEGFSSAHDEILRELSERFCERKNIFAVRKNFLH